MRPFCITVQQKTEKLFVAALALHPLGSTGTIMPPPLSSYCQAQFATQIKRAAFEEQGGQGEGETERESESKAKDETKTE